MGMAHRGRICRALLLAGAAFAACAGPALASPYYSLQRTIAVPPASTNPSGKFSAYDISFFDASTQDYYLADRSNASVDVFSAATNTFITRVPGFVGVGPTTSVSGPDGVLVTNGGGLHQLWAGDGDSTLKGFNIGPGHTYSTIPGTPIATGTPADKRVDEMAYDPNTKHLLVANNAATPPFATLIDATTNAILHKTVFDGTAGTPNATGGIEQSVYDPITNKFYLSIVQTDNTGPGGVSVIDPATGAVLNTVDFASFGIAACGPAGITVSTGGNLLVGCGDPSQSLILHPDNANNVTLVKAIPQASGSDQVWYDPTTNRYFLADRLDPTGPQLGIIDAATNTFLQNVPTTPGDHSVAVDPVSGEVFVPLGANAANAICPNGCIGVYAVPEPATLPMLMGALAALCGLARLRRRSAKR